MQQLMNAYTSARRPSQFQCVLLLEYGAPLKSISRTATWRDSQSLTKILRVPPTQRVTAIDCSRAVTRLWQNRSVIQLRYKAAALQGALHVRIASSLLSQFTVASQRTPQNCVSDSASASHTELGSRRARTIIESPQLPKTLHTLNQVCAGRLLDRYLVL
jgi:hypothetical protein